MPIGNYLDVAYLPNGITFLVLDNKLSFSVCSVSFSLFVSCNLFSNVISFWLLIFLVGTLLNLTSWTEFELFEQWLISFFRFNISLLVFLSWFLHSFSCLLFSANWELLFSRLRMYSFSLWSFSIDNSTLSFSFLEFEKSISMLSFPSF